MIGHFLLQNSNCDWPLRWPSGIVLASSAGGPGFNPQTRTVSYQKCLEMVPVVPLFGTKHLKGNTLSLNFFFN